MRKSERAPQNDPVIAGIYHGRAFAIVPNSYKFGKTTLVYYQKEFLIASKNFLFSQYFSVFLLQYTPYRGRVL